MGVQLRSARLRPDSYLPLTRVYRVIIDGIK